MTETYALVLNCGSSSFKFAIINANTGESALSGLAECLGSEEARIKWHYQGEKQQENLTKNAAHQEAITSLVNIIKSNHLESQLSAVGHRVVHGGEKFTSSVVITDDVLSTISDMARLAPLHNPANLIGIKAAQRAFPTLPQVAVFDTAFHQTIPECAYLYALPYNLYEEHGVRRYGFHGTSHYYVTEQAAKILNKPTSEINVISAHLGNGCSVTAIKNGQSVDTSMGLTPLEGLVMGTRSGDLDPGLFNYLTQQLSYSAEQVDALLNKKSGLLGLSTLSNDCRTLEEAMEQGNTQATLALTVFCYRLAKYIASYTVPLGKLDAVIFTGGIGENSAFIREKVLSLLTIFGFEVDNNANLAARFGAQGCITSATSPLALVIPTNEEWVIAKDALSLAHSTNH
ncbi:acetate kinase [Flocculibacter collagenilyticus]|uniref:acetate kinase n=1 Tax=Flocculibacter collagenilyticus TaxID=2744479 RepID=UPI0018F31E99|nr:acetate kinase [Flocculibacter collagenilyticus]